MVDMFEALVQTFTLPIQSGGYTVDDLEALPETNAVRFELFDGVLVVSPSPVNRHQFVVQEIGRILDAACPPQLVVNPLGQDVRLGDRTNVIPDVLVVRLSDIDLDDHFAHDLLLAVEVISPSSQGRDLGEKRDIYEELGVSSYWVVHPVDDWIKVFELSKGGYHLAAEVHGDNELRVSQPFAVNFRPSDLLARFRGIA